MAFFDNWGRKASEATAKTMQKAQDLSEISKLSSMISEEENRIDNNYYQIGKLYVSVHREDAESCFLPMVNAIRSSEQKISEYDLKIQDIKGVRKCEKCGAEVSKDAAYCSACGALLSRLEAAIPEGSIKCSKCGAIMKSGMRFCISCGTPIQQPPKISIPRQLSEPSSQSNIIQPSANFEQVVEAPESYNDDSKPLEEAAISQDADTQEPVLNNESDVCLSAASDKLEDFSASLETEAASEMLHEDNNINKHTQSEEIGAPSEVSAKESETKLCPNCGASVPKGFSFCGSCGASLKSNDIPTANTDIRCPNCGAVVEEGMLFCTECGYRISQTAKADESKPKSNICPNCGAEIADDMLFCTECGCKL